MEIIGNLLGYKVCQANSGNKYVQGWILRNFGKKDYIGKNILECDGDEIIEFGGFNTDFEKVCKCLKQVKVGSPVAVTGTLVNFKVNACLIEKA